MTRVKVGNTTIKIYHSKGALKPGSKAERYDQFTVAYRALDGEHRRETFGGLAKAKARANDIAVQIERGERDMLKLTSADRAGYVARYQASSRYVLGPKVRDLRQSLDLLLNPTALA